MKAKEWATSVTQTVDFREHDNTEIASSPFRNGREISAGTLHLRQVNNSYLYIYIYINMCIYM